tara:strand:- start:102 stop:986 length:885 start_codon:yes stop_codon:yes gene_type:complete
MKIKVFIVTYKNEDLLQNNLCSLLESDLVNHDFSINVINNYTEHFELQKFCDDRNIKVYHNYLRPDFSIGHLSRSWNQAIINGFKNLRSPDCDILVLAQNDNLFQKKWVEYILEMHKKYDFISMGAGDQYHSYNKNHIIKVGLWDERFCGNGFQENDYFIRSVIYNKDRTSISDDAHQRNWNNIENNIISSDPALIGGRRGDPVTIASFEHHAVSQKILMAKWAECGDWEIFCERIRKNKGPEKSLIPDFIYYPYFETNVDLRSNKNYLIPLPPHDGRFTFGTPATAFKVTRRR